MSADIIQFVPRANPDRGESIPAAVWTEAYVAPIIDPMRDLIPYEAPEKDPA